jgi:hypothetical protein
VIWATWIRYGVDQVIIKLRATGLGSTLYSLPKKLQEVIERAWKPPIDSLYDASVSKYTKN